MKVIFVIINEHHPDYTKHITVCGKAGEVIDNLYTMLKTCEYMDSPRFYKAFYQNCKNMFVEILEKTNWL